MWLTACAPLCSACDINGPGKCDATKCNSKSVYNSGTKKCDGREPLHMQSIYVPSVYCLVVLSLFVFFPLTVLLLVCLFINFFFVHLVVFLFVVFFLLVVLFYLFFFQRHFGHVFFSSSSSTWLMFFLLLLLRLLPLIV